MKLGHQVEGGVGPELDVVAFSTLCAHKGYPLNYNAASRTLNCPGHYSVYDVEKGGLEIWGHTAQNLAQFRLRFNCYEDAELADTIFAVGTNALETQTNYFLNHWIPNLRGESMKKKKKELADEPHPKASMQSSPRLPRLQA